VTLREANADLLAEITALRDRVAALTRENTELQAALTQASEQQTGTSEILRVISSSPTDLQPVMDTIAENAARLADAEHALIGRADGNVIRWVAFYGAGPISLQPITRSLPSGRAILDRQTTQIEDIGSVEKDEFTGPVVRAYRELGVRTILATPLLRKDAAVGVLLVRRTAVRPFTDKQIALLQTFADQAVIAIENVRLFTELQTSNRELTAALDTQTATSDILRVISRSPTDVQPVFDAIVASAVRLLGAHASALTQVKGDQIDLAAFTQTDDISDAALKARFPQSLKSAAGASHAQAIRDRQPRNIADALTDPRVTEDGRAYSRVAGFRSMVTVPLLRRDEAIGAIAVTRREPGGFTDDEIALLRTFAAQAVIAIENVRLFSELQTSNRELTTALDKQTATSDILRVISQSQTDVQPVFDTIVRNAVRLCGAIHGGVYTFDDGMIHARANEGYTPEQLEHWRSTFPRPVTSGSVVARAIRTNSVVLIDDLETALAFEVSRETLANLRVRGSRSLLAVPMSRQHQVIGSIALAHGHVGAFSEAHVELLRTFADQAVIAIENVRLFKELEAANRDLAAASQHKSEFLANMSHELRTPLNAIIGFSEVLSERMFGELNEKQDEYLKDINASGTHLLSLINDILDLSKIEAGRMELELTDFHLPTALDSALTFVRERAARRGIVLHMHVDNTLGQIQADERKIRQVVLNLLSNAIKFTPGGGRIEVAAVPRDNSVEVSVSDTGVGIAPEDQEAVFEEFRQVGTADKKVEGTGLGLTLCRKFVELHGGRIWVKSEVGAGSTFTFTIPLRRDE
jgi:signal transduction histidine kinase